MANYTEMIAEIDEEIKARETDIENLQNQIIATQGALQQLRIIRAKLVKKTEEAKENKSQEEAGEQQEGGPAEE